MITFASYNIHKGIGLDRRRNPERILAVINEIGADVIALQEADQRFGSRVAILSPMLLAGHSDYKAVPLDVQSDSMGWHGNVLLVRKAVEILNHDILHIPCVEPRGAVMADLAIQGRRVAVYGMHLDLSGLRRRQQALAICRHAEAHGAEQGMPAVLMGDLNEWSVAGGCLRDFARHYRFAPCGKSFHARRAVAELDRIMHSDGLVVQQCGVHDSALARRASDHLPVWAKMGFE